MTRETSSRDSILNASKSTAEFSGHGDALGSAGVKETRLTAIQDLLDKRGESGLITPSEGHDQFGPIHIGLSWNNVIVEKAGGVLGWLKKATKQGVDLDLGCFYELHDGTRGVLQPFGNLFGAYEKAPYIMLSGDERTGDAEGDDEYFTVNGAHWKDIKRILVYAYIYQGASDWAQIHPKVTIDIGNGEKPLLICPALKTSTHTVCCLVTMENVDNLIKLVTHGEYFTSHAAMDRAFGFGLQWEDGAKD